MIHCQLHLGDMNTAFGVIEQRKCREFLEAIQQSAEGTMNGVPQDLLQRRDTLLNKLDMLQRELSAVEISAQEQRRNLVSQVGYTRQQITEVFGDIQNVSPAHQITMPETETTALLGRFVSYLKDRDIYAVQLIVGENQSFAMFVPPDGKVLLWELKADEYQAAALGIPAGPLGSHTLDGILWKDDDHGLLNVIGKKPTNSETCLDRGDQDRLYTLWNIIFPDQVIRSSLTDGTIRRLLILPDGGLNRLPFETLVVDIDDFNTTYLLDIGPSIQYAPSATIVMNLSEHNTRIVRNTKKSALSVGISDYSKMAGFGSLYEIVDECKWAKLYLDKSGFDTELLLNNQATEANIRKNIEGHDIIHLACHGDRDPIYAMFASLVVFPGSNDGIEDDGRLTLHEIYSLKLKDCQLTILSACDTNYGPNQMGEGNWALSRGFFVAGAKRVMSNAWSVNDESSAALVEYYCYFLSESETDEIDYAAALQESKQTLPKTKPEWRHPYYWAPLIINGIP